KDVHPRVGICRSQAHAMNNAGTFPAPFKLGARASAWVESEINDWIESRISASRNEGGAA
ncbi:MAG: AlpA family phage regulatory protein, partial [Pseudomonadota bacterium]|nr:AlpA family phage regulatory protein [Pseudomonadota bacterium]